MLRRAIESPLAHCLVLGLLLSLAWEEIHEIGGRTGRSNESATHEELLVRAARDEGLDELPAVRDRLARLADFLGAAPDDASYDEQVNAARALGLDRSDPVVQQYLAAAMSERLVVRAPIAAPSAADIARFLAEQPDRFVRPARVRIRHLYLGGFDESAHRRSRQLARAAASREASFADLLLQGDVFYGGHQLPLLSEPELASRFGADFAGRLADQPPGWIAEPLSSPYGQHVVEVLQRSESRPEDPEVARDLARRQLERLRAEEARATELAGLRRRRQAAVEQETPGSDS